MKIKKIKAALLSVGLCTIILALALFIIIPFICGSGFEYAGFSALGAGIASLFAFDFENTMYTLLFAFLVITVICAIIWGSIIGAKKQKKNFAAFAFVVLFVLVMDFLMATFFLAKVSFNGAEGKLFDSMMATDGQVLGKALSMSVLALAYISLMFLTLFAFIDIFTLMLGNRINRIFEEPKEQVVIAKEVDPTVGLDDRIKREEAFFEECVNSGEFERFDELEFEEPLEGFTEEPVIEDVTIEEETNVITRRNFVKVAKVQKNQAK